MFWNSAAAQLVDVSMLAMYGRSQPFRSELKHEFSCMCTKFESQSMTKTDVVAKSDDPILSGCATFRSEAIACKLPERARRCI